jgi:hypothetical protein
LLIKLATMPTPTVNGGPVPDDVVLLRHRKYLVEQVLPSARDGDEHEPYSEDRSRTGNRAEVPLSKCVVADSERTFVTSTFTDRGQRRNVVRVLPSDKRFAERLQQHWLALASTAASVPVGLRATPNPGGA